MHIQRRFLLILAAALLAVGLADAALAQSGLWNDVRGNLTPVGNAFGTPGVPADPRSVVAVVIKIFMGILGIIYLVYTVHAGFVLMTSGGETDKIDQAKSTLEELVKTAKESFRVAEVPISFEQRTYGRSGVDPLVDGSKILLSIILAYAKG